MISRYISAAESFGPCDALAAGERQALAASLPPAAVRRCSDNGLQLAALLQTLAPAEDEPLIMASSYAEARALEAFLGSFPTPSPLRFQTSVHPSGVQQGRVALQAPLRSFIPMTGCEALGLLACREALFRDESSVLLLGGEEKGGWLIEVGNASDCGYAFGLRLTIEAPAMPLGQIHWSAEPDGSLTAQHGLWDLFQAIRERSSLAISHADIGTLRLAWQ